MASTNRTGRVSAIDYEAGTYEVTYFDRGKSVTRQINAMSNGEYKMPCVGQVVSVAHNSNGTAAGTTTGTVWNKTNKPAEGYKGLYRKEYGTSRKGQAYSRYDENTGVYTQYVDKRTGRTCNGEIFDEAKGPVSVIAGGQLQLKSSGASASIQAKTGMGIVAGTTVAIEAGTFMSLEATSATPPLPRCSVPMTVGQKALPTIAHFCWRTSGTRRWLVNATTRRPAKRSRRRAMPPTPATRKS